MQTIANFSINYQQFLDPKGIAVQTLPDWVDHSDLLTAMYKHMVLVRTFDQKVIALQRTGQMGTYPSCLGQEAIGTAIGFAMNDDDVLAPYYRDQAIQLLRDVSMADIMRYWGGDERGSDFGGIAKEDLPNCVPIATQITHAAGIASAMKIRQQHRAVVTTCGEGATSRGDFYESLNLAGTWQLPMVVVVNNNQWAISVPRSIQTAAQTIAQKAVGAGIKGIQVDGNDPIAVYEAVTEAVQHARRGKGATLIEAVSYRLCDHTTADDATRYRSNEELNAGWDNEPVARVRNFLSTKGLWDEAQEVAWQEECVAQLKEAVDEYLATPEQPPESMFDYLYADPPMEILEQREQLQEKVTSHVKH